MQTIDLLVYLKIVLHPGHFNFAYRYNSPFRKCYPNCGNGEDADADDPYWYGGQWRKTFNGFDNRQGCSKWLIINGGMKRDLIESLQSRGYLEADMTATWMHNGFPTPTTTTPATTIPTRRFIQYDAMNEHYKTSCLVVN